MLPEEHNETLPENHSVPLFDAYGQPFERGAWYLGPHIDAEKAEIYYVLGLIGEGNTTKKLCMENQRGEIIMITTALACRLYHTSENAILTGMRLDKIRITNLSWLEEKLTRTNCGLLLLEVQERIKKIKQKSLKTR